MSPYIIVVLIAHVNLAGMPKRTSRGLIGIMRSFYRLLHQRGQEVRPDPTTVTWNCFPRQINVFHHTHAYTFWIHEYFTARFYLSCCWKLPRNIFLFSPWRSMDVHESGWELPWTPMAIPTVGGRGRIHYYGGP